MFPSLNLIRLCVAWPLLFWPLISYAQNCPLCGHEWAEAATPESVQELFDVGVSPNGLSKFNSPLLFLLAMKSSDVRIAEAFVAEAASRNVELNLVVMHDLGYVESTVLHYAARNDSSAMLEYFLELGADPHLRDGRDKTPLAVAPGYTENVDVYLALLEAGVDPNAADALGWTVLHGAARFSKNPEIFRILVNHGGSIDTKTDNGLTPIIIAERHRQPEIAELLESLGAK